MNRTDKQNPNQPAAKTPKGALDVTQRGSRQKLLAVLFWVTGILSLIPPITMISIGCMIFGFLFLCLATRTRKADRNIDRVNREVAIALLTIPGLVLTSAVMFAGTCNSIVWPVVLYNAYPAIRRPDLIKDVPGPNLAVGMIAGAVMATTWCVWWVKKKKDGCGLQ